ncbi:MAG TPA: iron-siderophore ABC transporter substrate-binding protein [Limnochordales bacterium]
MSRRRVSAWFPALAFLMVSALLASCGGDAPAQDAGARAPSGDGPFPVTIEHKFGTTTIPNEPKRVVAVGYHDHEALLALGVAPVAVRYNYGDHPYGVFPWAQDELGGATPVVLEMPDGELDFEAIARLQPDLISAVYSGITEEEYRTLSRIAPTLAQTGDYIDFGIPWQEQTRLIGAAVGRSQRAEAVIAETEARFAEVRRQHPEFAGKTVILAVMRPDGQVGLLSEQDVRTRTFTSLGFQLPPEIRNLFGDSFYTFLSSEQLRLLDTADVVVWHQMEFSPGRAAIAGHPLYATLRVAREGRHVFLTGTADDALQFSTVLSLPFLLERLVPQLAAALDGDPATEAATP